MVINAFKLIALSIAKLPFNRWSALESLWTICFTSQLLSAVVNIYWDEE